MNISEKAAYLKGLMDGLKLDQEAPEGKMISGIVELLQKVTGAIGDLQENAEAVSDELDEIEDDLDAIEDYLMVKSWFASVTTLTRTSSCTARISTMSC